ncbi:uncharacterized protein PFB0765w-like [Rosa chinensis]|uniref:uncharacterized protein PFB0765w-like n=1 Tax=Rosa chinensis TaxID=74649 RepID=UPI000D0931D2|nr:uncharacterized protein PFB0765w-like [Rosa chinensis]
MKDIIDSLEEATTQTSLSQEENQKTQDLLKKLTEENEKLARQNDRYWEMLDKAFEEDNIATRKIQILQNKLLKKWKVFTTIEKEKKNLEDVIEQQRETIHNLKNELLEMERKLLEKDMLDSQEDLRKDDIKTVKVMVRMVKMVRKRVEKELMVKMVETIMKTKKKNLK